jgi:microcystin degradation protein MlrC
MPAPRILVGRLWHEGHSFNPVLTTRADMTIIHGAAMLDEARTGATALSGIVREADRIGARLIPSLSASARPGGPIERELFEDIAAGFVDAAGQSGIDAICLELHGATTAQHIADTEGTLLARLRKTVGGTMPIAVALDLHGHITHAMVQAATVMTGYRTNPHADMVETGARAMALLVKVLRTGCLPRATLLHVPFLTRGNDETSHGPLAAICAAASEWRMRPGMLDVSMFNTHPFIDMQGLGQKLLAYDDGTGLAEDCCRDLGQQLWNARDDFFETLPDVAATLRQASVSPKPFVLGDQGDRVLGAGPGDSAEIARVAMQQFPQLRFAAPVYDPAAVAAAQAVGAGQTLTYGVGGHITPHLRPLEAAWHVERLFQAHFTNQGPYMAGLAADFGAAAVLRQGNLCLIATSRAPNVHDPAFFAAAGLPIAGQYALVAKSGNHYKLSFAGLAHAVTVDTPGLTAFRPQDLPFMHARPVHPLDDMSWPPRHPA